jgi:hypothetical protein
MNELERLKQIVYEGGFDEESKQDVLQLEQELQEIAAAEKLSLNPVIQKFIAYLEAQAESCTRRLATVRSLTDLERQVLFEKRDLCEHFTSLFTGQKKQLIEDQIKTHLDAARNQSPLR